MGRGKKPAAEVSDDDNVNEAPPAKKSKKETVPKAKGKKADEPSSSKDKKPKKPKKEVKVYASKEEEEADLKKKALFRKLMSRKPPTELGTMKFPVGSPDCFAGQYFVITGVLEHFKRDTFEAGITRHGGTVQKAISKTKTNYLIAGRDCGEKKKADAEKFGIKVISEEEFYDMLRATNPDHPANKPEEEKKSASSEEENEESSAEEEESEESSDDKEDDDDDDDDE